MRQPGFDTLSPNGFDGETMKLTIKRKAPKGRAPHRPTKVERPRVQYDRARTKQSLREELKAEGEAGDVTRPQR